MPRASINSFTTTFPSFYNHETLFATSNRGLIYGIKWIKKFATSFDKHTTFERFYLLFTSTLYGITLSKVNSLTTIDARVRQKLIDGSDEEFGMTDEEEILGHEDDEEVEDEHTGRDEAINTENMEDHGETNCTVENDMNLDTMNENMDYVDENFAEDDDDINLHVLDELMELMENDDIEEQYYDGDNEESDYDTDTDENDDDLNETIVKGKTAEKNKSGLE